MPNYRHTSIRIPEKLLTELKIMCVLTNTTIGKFIAIAVQEKINELKKSKEIGKC